MPWLANKFAKSRTRESNRITFASAAFFTAAFELCAGAGSSGSEGREASARRNSAIRLVVVCRSTTRTGLQSAIQNTAHIFANDGRLPLGLTRNDGQTAVHLGRVCQ
jgi:hypothetical protein